MIKENKIINKNSQKINHVNNLKKLQKNKEYFAQERGQRTIKYK